MRKGIIIAVTLLGGLLAACGNQSAATPKSKPSSSSSQVAKTKSATSTSTASSSHQTNVVWTANKAQQLAKFMTSWGTTMHQQYDSYDSSHNTDFYGLKYPAEFSNDNLMVNDSAATIAWSKTGVGKADYKVVAIYSDSKHTTETMGAHLYLFTIHQGQPVVLVTQQNQGNSENKVYFKTTENTDLASGFSSIVAGHGVPSSSTSSAAHQSTSSATRGPKAYNISSEWAGTWYTADQDGQVTRTTFTDHTQTTTSPDGKPWQKTWYLNDNSDPDAKDNVHNHWVRVTGTVQHNDITMVSIRGWNQTSGAGAFYGIKRETVDGQRQPVLIEAGGGGVWCDQVFYRSLATAQRQKTSKFDDIDYGSN